MKRVCEILLRLYPANYRATFGAEMLGVLAEKAREHDGQRAVGYVRFVIPELAGLAIGAVVQWCARIACYGSASGHAPAAASRAGAGGRALPEVMEAEIRVQVAIDRMVDAIATHQFEKARFYSEEERKAREVLGLLRRQYDIREQAG